MNIGFIGLGNMGTGMASNLATYCIANNHRLIVHDIDPKAVDRLLCRGAEDGLNTQNLCSQVEVLFTSLPSAAQIKQLAMGKAGILQNLPPDARWFETSTNELGEWQALKAAAPARLIMIDAPVTGGAEGALAGTLTMLLGIEEQLLAQHAELLSSFTGKAVRMGPSGAGYVSKLCQLHLNYLVAEGIGEALMLGAKADIDLSLLHRILQNSCAQSYVVDSYIPKILDGSYDPSFTLGLATKDMRLISELGQHLKVPLKLADQVLADYAAARDKYGVDSPHLKIVKLIEDKMELSLRGSK